jgi:hypothetical protein
MSYLALAMWLVVVMLLAYAARAALSRALPPRAASIVFFPGLLVHDLSRAAAALLTGVTVREVNLYEISRPRIILGKAKVPLLGDVAVALAPFVGAGLAVWLVLAALGHPVPLSTPTPPAFELSVTGVVELAKNMLDMLADSYLAVVYPADLASWQLWAGLAAAVVFTVTMAPTSADFKFAAAGFGLVVLGIYVAALATGLPILWALGWYRVLKVITFACDVLLLATAAGLAVMGARRLLGPFARRPRGRAPAGRPVREDAD